MQPIILINLRLGLNLTACRARESPTHCTSTTQHSVETDTSTNHAAIYVIYFEHLV